MTTAKYWDDQEERESYLIIQLISGTTVLLTGYKDWVHDEVEALLQLGRHLEYSNDGLAQRMVQLEIRRLEAIRDDDLGTAKESVESKIKDINNGTYDNVIDARRYLEEGLYRFETILRDLLSCRRKLEEFETVTREPMDPPGGNGHYPVDPN